MQVTKNIFFRTEFVIDNKPPLKKRTVTHDYVVPEVFAEVHFGYWRTTFRSQSFLTDVCFFLCWKCLSKECCLNKVIFSVILVKILHYIQHAFSFRIRPVKTMTGTTIDLLWYYQDCFTKWHYQCFERFD